MKKKKINDTENIEFKEMHEDNKLDNEENNIKEEIENKIDINDTNKVKEKPIKTEEEQKEFSAKLLMNYIGENYKKIIKQKFSFPGFLFNSLYLIYRKMYLLGISIYFLLILLTSIFIDNTIILLIISIIYLIISILIGIFVNKKYCEKAYEECIEMNKKYNYISDEAIIKICKKRGGTNITAVIVTILLGSFIAISSSVVIRTLINFNFNKTEIIEENNLNEEENNITNIEQEIIKENYIDNVDINNTNEITDNNQISNN